MRIIEHRALRGPNRYSRYPTIFMLLDIGALEDRPSDAIGGFPERLVKWLPTLQEHECSVGQPGGFIQRLHRGTWAGHIVEHISLELQCLAGMKAGFGKTFQTSERGVYEVVYRYRVESAGLAAGRHAVALVSAAIADDPYDLASVIAELKELREEDMLGPSTSSIVEEAKKRGLPALRLNSSSFVQIGYGARQRRIQATMTDRTGALGVEIAQEKFRTKQLLRQAGIPAPAGEVVDDLRDALRVAEDLGFPVAVKPEVGNHGHGITACVAAASDMELAFLSAQKICRPVVVERSLTGFDFRLLIIDGRLVAAAQREPAHVIGDGKSTIKELIDIVNQDPRRGFGHERMLTRIVIDDMTHRLLAMRDYSVDTVLPASERLHVKSTANLSTGGTSRDVTDQVHPDVRFMCERIARIVGLDCIGIDIVAPTLDQPLNAESAGVVEVNAAPGFRMHLNPTEGTPRNVAAPFVDMLFSPKHDHAVPIVAVTGTNGKTTTARLIAHTLKYAGGHVGLASTAGVEIDGVTVVAGDYSGPEGAGIVLREPLVDHAVLEVARGGLLRRGLGFDNCTVGVLLNVGKDHIGCEGVADLEELGRVKSTVVEVVLKDTGVSVLNADDPTVVSLREHAGGRVIYFSLQTDNVVVAAHIRDGGTAITLEEETVLIRSREHKVQVFPIHEAPITLRGVATFNSANVLAAVAALYGLGTPVEMIRIGISTFHPSATQNPGRMNVIDFVTFKVIVDYGHNVPAVQALAAAMPHITAGRKIVVAHGVGNRPDSLISEFGAALADVYDHIIIADVDPRGRERGETPELVRRGAIEHGFAEPHVEVVEDPLAAVDRAFDLVQAGDLIVGSVRRLRTAARSRHGALREQGRSLRVARSEARPVASGGAPARLPITRGTSDRCHSAGSRRSRRALRGDYRSSRSAGIAPCRPPHTP